MREAIDDALKSRFIELAVESGPWPCDVAHAGRVVLVPPAGPPPPPPPPPPDGSVAEATLPPSGIQDLADLMPEILSAAVGHDFRFIVRIDFGDTRLPKDVLLRLNPILSKVSSGWLIKG